MFFQNLNFCNFSLNIRLLNLNEKVKEVSIVAKWSYNIKKNPSRNQGWLGQEMEHAKHDFLNQGVEWKNGWILQKKKKSQHHHNWPPKTFPKNSCCFSLPYWLKSSIKEKSQHHPLIREMAPSLGHKHLLQRS